MSILEWAGLAVGFLTAFGFLLRVRIFIGPRAHYMRITGLILGSIYFAVLCVSLSAWGELSSFAGSEPHLYIRPMTSGAAAGLLAAALLGYVTTSKSSDQESR
ncbi:MAG: hypothetical protein ACREXY_12385 [Gammaproteobacteria bacterium]